MMYTGRSMLPTIHEKDLLTVAQVEKSGRGDVVVFSSPVNGESVVHRIVELRPEGYVTRGDNNRDNDPFIVTPERVIGRVELIRRGGKPIPVTHGLCGLLGARRRRSIERARKLIRRIILSALPVSPFDGCGR